MSTIFLLLFIFLTTQGYIFAFCSESANQTFY